MDFLTTMLPLIALAFPEAAPAIAIISKVAPYASPIIAAAIKEGPSAYRAAVNHAPQLAHAIQDLTVKVYGSAEPHHLDAVTKRLFGAPMSFAEEQDWMNKSTLAAPQG